MLHAAAPTPRLTAPRREARRYGVLPPPPPPPPPLGAHLLPPATLRLYLLVWCRKRCPGAPLLG